MKRFLARLPLLDCIFAECEWFRKAYGGKWMQTHVDHPVCGFLWLPVPDDATPDYREPMWRGTPNFKDYDLP